MKNNTPSSEFKHEDKCPSCGSLCNIHTDLDDNDKCNECRNEIDTLELGQIVPKKISIAKALEILQKHLNLTNPKPSAILDAMVEFTEIHVKEALKEASEQAEIESEKIVTLGGTRYEDSVSKDSILNAYPLTNIK